MQAPPQITDLTSNNHLRRLVCAIFVSLVRPECKQQSNILAEAPVGSGFKLDHKMAPAGETFDANMCTRSSELRPESRGITAVVDL